MFFHAVRIVVMQHEVAITAADNNIECYYRKSKIQREKSTKKMTSAHCILKEREKENKNKI